ncbi:hypothetical protein TSUD_21520 [Trifolium subterraneum]|uniref:Uncharacterized protein n=1 Tax=Trifolium subterraneum TaxID=3900 RepID=A0A2Z6MYK6_TRISU|nr:hypothetical protein TSUD_21520 [Trifolium subterraneum]
MTEETVSSNQQHNEDPHHEPVEEVDFDSCPNEYIFDEEKKVEKPLSVETRIKFERPEPNGEFIMSQLDGNPEKAVKVGTNLPYQIQESLIRCLKVNADVFATTMEDMPRTDPEVVATTHKILDYPIHVGIEFLVTSGQI